MRKTHTMLFSAAAVVVAIGLTLAFVDPAAASEAARHLVGAASDTFHLMVANVPVVASLKALRERRAGLVADMQAIINEAETDDRDLSEEEQTRFDALKADKEKLDARIGRMDEMSATVADLSATVPAQSRRQHQIHRAGGPEAKKEFESIGEFMHAVRFNPNDQRLHFVENASANVDDLSAEMRMDNDTQGGFMVPTQLSTTIMRVQPQDALIRPRATVIPAGSPPDASYTMPALDQTGTNPGNMFGGVEVRWINEGEDKPETDAKLREVTLTPHEVAGFVTVTDKLLRNWQASGPFVEGLLRGGVAAGEDYAFMRGTGVGQPMGVINSGATKWINRALANHVTYADLLTMVSRFLMRSGSPVWSAPQSALVDIATMQDPEGHYIWQANARDGFAGDLLGYPLRWNNRAPALGTKGDIVLGDYSNYLIKDGSGPFVAASEHVLFKQNKTIIKIFWNVDGTPWLTAPIKEENGYDVSPFVGLDVPA